MPNNPTRTAAWNIDLGKFQWLYRMVAPLLDPILEKYLTKLQDNLSAKAEKEFGAGSGDKMRKVFWESVDLVAGAFYMDLDDLTPDK